MYLCWLAPQDVGRDSCLSGKLTPESQLWFSKKSQDNVPPSGALSPQANKQLTGSTRQFCEVHLAECSPPYLCGGRKIGPPPHLKPAHGSPPARSVLCSSREDLLSPLITWLGQSLCPPCDSLGSKNLNSSNYSTNFAVMKTANKYHF